ncbi:MAG: 2-nitropropane dioxygenase [Bdellovibrio sp. CG12_big_fil_rev_8_21_14_0_65_39_13]|nr:MAG: 2-nitropropane dioxygenase [Bdellovibrio sp. CG22_combo_CG10-13_8_21_14_all_39_27]PIQ58705.1 MAG: 2-nitropropane dioxygenase [Bdellovibrio sp. CG12_big_fil_rev_8_21_14_0_65_39_13]PIR33080.1 MAG: 2-nitropropane dioxygenase [Bdellovibrio sp. CG11_big_fil_rev_8_21_14_0_20_39_38]PJB53294.1 MAG: nitronate monooxygenase [Bdellovibrio sp. CG_4_9_14_3_um_filter_39_7]
MQTWITKEFNIKYPIIMAPMFLVSNEEMLIAAAESGIMGCIPALNYRTPELFEEGMKRLKDNCKGPFGVNLIVNKSNIVLEKQMEICERINPDFVITSLGSPEETIKRLQPKGVRVLCDVVDVEYALKVEKLGADALIAVNSGAGGHAGPIPASILVPMLRKSCKLPVISAGGVGTGEGLLSVLALGAEGVSVGSPFISCVESPVSAEYKKACLDFGAKDIALTTKVSGSPCTVIVTPYVKKIGLDQNVVEKVLNKNKQLKKYAKMLTFYKGMKALEKAAFSATYKTVWCAGPSIEFIDREMKVKDFVDKIIGEYKTAHAKLGQLSLS